MRNFTKYMGKGIEHFNYQTWTLRMTWFRYYMDKKKMTRYEEMDVCEIN